MTKTETKALSINDVLDTFYAREAAIEAVKPQVGTYVLAWLDNALFVRLADDRQTAGATGFEHATIWGDKAAALSYLRRTGLVNGRSESPVPVLAFNAKQHALAELAKVIAIVVAQAGEA